MMKIITLMMTLLICESAIAEGALPMSWINPSLGVFQKGMADEEVSKSAEEKYTNLIDAKFEVIDGAAEKSKRNKWYLQSIKSEIGLETVGTFGLFGLKGETAVEFVWVRTKESKQRLLDRHLEEKSIESEIETTKEADEVITVSPWSGEESLRNTSRNIARGLFKSGKVEDPELLEEGLLAQMKDFQKVAAAMESSSPDRPWWAYKYQIEVLVEATGKVVPVLSAGLGVRLRLEWYRYSKTAGNKSVMPASGQDLQNGGIIEALGEDLAALESVQISKTRYNLNFVKVGVGVGVKGDIFVAKAKGHVLGSLFFKRNPPSKMQKAYQPFQKSMTEIPMYEESADGGMLTTINREAFRKGLTKVSKMAKFFAKGAVKSIEKKRSKGKMVHFDLQVLELELELFARMGVGLVTLEGIGVLELFLVKQG